MQYAVENMGFIMSGAGLLGAEPAQLCRDPGPAAGAGAGPSRWRGMSRMWYSMSAVTRPACATQPEHASTPHSSHASPRPRVMARQADKD